MSYQNDAMPSAQQEKPESELDFTNLHLYGREKEIAVLKEAYKKSFNSSQVVWLKGYSGVGKSTLVDFVFQDKEFYCSGKFERVRHVVPFSVLADLLSKICYNLEFDSPTVELDAQDASLLSKLVPEVKDVLKYDHQHHQTTPCNMEWGLERLKQAIQSFVKAVCEKILLKNKLPLVLFLDDLQWSDADTLAIMQDFLSADIEGLLFVGSYRDNEVDDGDPLSLCIRAIEEARPRGIAQLPVTNLNTAAVNHLVADLTHMRLQDVEPLSQLIYSKTDGNCFFSLHMLRYLSEKGFLYVSQTSWKWKEERIQANIDVSENVVDFMSKKLQELPLVTLNALMIAACLGTTCVYNDLLESLMPLLKPVADFSVFVDVLEAAEAYSLIEMYPDGRRFRFSHDKVADVVYEQLSEGKAEALHLEIGRKLRSLHVEAETEVHCDRWRLFLAVDQYNRGSELIESRIERVELAELNLYVAREVIKSSAFKLASAFLDNGIGLLGVQRWEKHYDLTLKLSNLRASVLLGQGVLKGCLALVKQI